MLERLLLLLLLLLQPSANDGNDLGSRKYYILKISEDDEGPPHLSSA